jgi:hypothetical protein
MAYTKDHYPSSSSLARSKGNKNNQNNKNIRRLRLGTAYCGRCYTHADTRGKKYATSVGTKNFLFFWTPPPKPNLLLSFSFNVS